VSPWPNADGNGLYLQLRDIALDNSLPESWEAADRVITSVENPAGNISISLFPNPVSELLIIHAGAEISNISLYDMHGTILLSQECQDMETTVNLSSLAPGTYIIRIFTAEGSYPRMIVKN